MPYTDAELIGLVGLQGRNDTFRFDLLDPALNVTGVIEVSEGSVPTITNDLGSAVQRTMTGFSLDAALVGSVSTVSDRVRPMLILENGSEFALGVFLFTDAARQRRSFGAYMDGASLGDQHVILNQPLDRGYSYGNGTYVTTALAELAQGAFVPSLSIDADSTTISEPVAFAIGANRLQAIQTLCALCGFVEYFDNAGTLRMGNPPDPDTATPTFDYAAGGTIFDGTIVESDDLLTAPNAYIVINSASRDVPVFGRYNIPSSAPHSYANRGFYVPKVIDLQSVTSNALASNAARAAYMGDSDAFEWASFSTVADPRQDTYDLVTYASETYRQQSWGLTLSSGGAMTHSLRKVYA